MNFDFTITPIEAYRTMRPRYTNTGEAIEPRLFSYGETIWQPGQPLKAECRADGPKKHGSPEPMCGCGIYGTKKPQKGSWIKIALSGIVIEHEHGYRAQYAELVAVHEPCAVCNGWGAAANPLLFASTAFTTYLSYQFLINPGTPAPNQSEFPCPSTKEIADAYGVPLLPALEGACTCDSDRKAAQDHPRPADQSSRAFWSSPYVSAIGTYPGSLTTIPEPDQPKKKTKKPWMKHGA